jgi:hypothetical protein
MDFEDLFEDVDEAGNGGTINGTGSDDPWLFTGMNQEEA